jgi:hypothetical protein
MPFFRLLSRPVVFATMAIRHHGNLLHGGEDDMEYGTNGTVRTASTAVRIDLMQGCWTDLKLNF